MVKRFLVLAGLVLALLIAGNVASLSSLDGGAAFTPGNEINGMPAGWVGKTVEHGAQFKDDDLVVALDHSGYRIFSPMISEYARKKGVKISVIDGTCGNSIGLLYRKQIDIGGLCCPPGANDRIPGLRFYTLGITPVGVIVNRGNPVDEMMLRDVRKIYTGEIHKWAELDSSESGAMEGHILAVSRLHCKERPGHWRRLLDRDELFTSEVIEVGTIPDMISVVASSPGAIGLESLWLATDFYKDRWKVKALRINGMNPGNLKHLESGAYPLYRVLNIAVWDRDVSEGSLAYDLAMHMMKYIELNGRRFDIVSSSALRNAGWKFQDEELVGEPE